MQFEVNLPRRLDTCFLGRAGLTTDAYHERNMDVILKKAPLPTNVSCPYFLSEKPIDVRVSVLSYSPTARLKIEVSHANIGRRIKDYLTRYSVENDGEALSNREHKALWAKIETILKRDGLSYDKLHCKGTLLTRRALESLMKLSEKTEWQLRENIHGLFLGDSVARNDREFTARWLLKLLEAEKDPCEQISVRVWELAVPQIAGELIRLIQDGRQGEKRGCLCLALAKTRHPRAAEVIASVVGEKGVTRWALEALGKLKAANQAKVVKKYLRDPDSDIRREAQKTLRKMGLPVEPAPPPIHLVKGRRSVPKGLEEWSANLDMADLKPTLESLAKCVAKGFGCVEIAEVIGVADEMEQDQTKAFSFPIRAAGRKSELWLVTFMDDIDSPDLGIHADAEIIEKFVPPLRD